MHPYQPPAPRPRNRNATILIVLAVLFGLLFVGCSVAVVAASGGAKGQSATPPRSTATAAGNGATPAGESTSPAAYTPTAADFTLKAKITRKACFDTAGCNVTFRIDMSYSGQPLDPDTEYDVTYKVYGPEDGPEINTATVQGDQFSSDEDMVSTPSSGTRLRVVVTDVSAA